MTTPCRRDSPDGVVACVREPQGAVRPGRDPARAADAGSGVVGNGPAVVMRPMELLPELVNHSAPSGPAVIPIGPSMLGSLKWVETPFVVIRPIELVASLVNQSASSEPVVVCTGTSMLESE